MKKIKENQLKAINISRKRDKAKENAFLEDGLFDIINIHNHVKKVSLKAKMVEYEVNMNPRYAKKEKEFYNSNLSREEKILKKSNGNMERLMQIVNNANKNFTMEFQYIVFEKKLVNIIREWLDELRVLNLKLNYGKIDEDIKELKKIFPDFNKDWLVIDGNSYFSTIHEIYLGKQILHPSKDERDIQYWAKFYAQATSKGKAYTSDKICLKGYEKDIQMLQLISLVLDKNMHSWNETDRRIFAQRLHRITFAIAYKECKKKNMSSLKDVCSTFQALKYLILPNNQATQFQISKRMDYMTFVSLFQYTGNLMNVEQLNITCYNIKLFRNIIEGIITRNAHHLSFDYTMDCLNEIYQAEVEYQNLSLKPIQGIEGIQARDRLQNITALCNDNWLLEARQIKNEIISGDISIEQIRSKLHKMVLGMVNVYEDFLNKNAELIAKRNNNLSKSIENLYHISTLDKKVCLDDFSEAVYKLLKELQS